MLNSSPTLASETTR